jgi:hypothetical protein
VRLGAPTEAEIAERLRGSGVDAARAAQVARAAGASAARAQRVARAGVLDVVERLVGAALAPEPSVATVADAVVETLRRVAPEAAPREDAGGVGSTPVPAGESLREVLDDLFHALQSLARDRVAGRPAGPLDAVPVDAAAAALSEWTRVAPFVRRNVTPAALVIEAGAILRRAVRPGAIARA